VEGGPFKPAVGLSGVTMNHEPRIMNDFRICSDNPLPHICPPLADVGLR
jgi:hypothetical protein